jgi:hypothetical protein
VGWFMNKAHQKEKRMLFTEQVLSIRLFLYNEKPSRLLHEKLLARLLFRDKEW